MFKFKRKYLGEHEYLTFRTKHIQNVSTYTASVQFIFLSLKRVGRKESYIQH